MHQVDRIDEDEVMDLITQGWTQTKIAARFGIDQGNYNRWLYSDKHRLTRARDAMTRAAQAYADMALDELDAAQDPIALARARDKAFHLRWLSSRYNRALFGDKLDIQQDTTLHITVRRDDLDTVEMLIDEHKQGLMDEREGGVVRAGGVRLEGNPTSTALPGVSSMSGVASKSVDAVEEKPKKRKSKGSWIHGGGVMLTPEEMEKDTNSGISGEAKDAK